MPDVPYDATWRAVCHQSRLGEESVNVHHFRWNPEDPVLPGTLNGIAVAFSQFYNNNVVGTDPDRGIRLYRAGSSVLDSVRLYDLRTVPNPAVHEVTFTDVVTPAGTAVPTDVAAVITLRTATGGRSGRGRLYIGPLADAAMMGAVGEPAQFHPNFQQDLIDAYVDLCVRLNAAVTPDPITPAVLSVTDGLSRPIISITVDRRPDTQRRRDLGMTFGPQLSSPIP